MSLPDFELDLPMPPLQPPAVTDHYEQSEQVSNKLLVVEPLMAALLACGVPADKAREAMLSYLQKYLPEQADLFRIALESLIPEASALENLPTTPWPVEGDYVQIDQNGYIDTAMFRGDTPSLQ